MYREVRIVELDGSRLPAVVRLCGTALDLAEDAAEAAAIVARLRESPHRTAGVWLALAGDDLVGVA